MAHEILSAKLYELEQRIGQVYSRIQLSETADHAQLQETLVALKKECAENKLALADKIKFSKAKTAAKIAGAYGKIGRIMENTKTEVMGSASEGVAAQEETILLAEYALDFAMQAAEEALILSLEAIDAQYLQQNKKGSETA